ncbi:hypothetical protein DPM13_16325 [Paracoccus mutanolyticus]|uniref:MarR family transcriptional regulator n=1 Tax=Paracoccus mutanolyticus TaxID=1499308 RepID=A0ABN5M7T4_9RHOB|nr:hypothetical protein [Paracoccus mutanolyticus]AWX93991.1 hypothetical protein DPM13_16325 [Paracoccus mutanolyticus]
MIISPDLADDLFHVASWFYGVHVMNNDAIWTTPCAGSQYVGQRPHLHLSGRGFTLREEVACRPRNSRYGGSGVKARWRSASRSFAKDFEATGELAAWPSERTLNAETGMFRSQIGRAVKALEENGHLVVHRPEKHQLRGEG